MKVLHTEIARLRDEVSSLETRIQDLEDDLSEASAELVRLEKIQRQAERERRLYTEATGRAPAVQVVEIDGEEVEIRDGKLS